MRIRSATKARASLDGEVRSKHCPARNGDGESLLHRCIAGTILLAAARAGNCRHRRVHDAVHATANERPHDDQDEQVRVVVEVAEPFFRVRHIVFQELEVCDLVGRVGRLVNCRDSERLIASDARCEEEERDCGAGGKP